MTEDPMAEMARLLERFTGRDGVHATEVGPLSLYRSSEPTEPAHVLYQPALCLIAQGSKRVLLGERCYQYDPAHFLLVSVDLPLVGQVLGATPHRPYLALRLDLDPQMIAAVLADSERQADAPPPGRTPRGVAVSRLDPPLLDSVLRLLRLLCAPQDVPVLAPLTIREILYRLLTGEQGTRLRQIAAEDSRTERIARAIHWLKQNYARPFRIEDVARAAYMSPSALHHHFKAVTSLSPLQYQKQLRLQEARRLMLGEAVDAATAGFRVGYESASQFSREYRRQFGAPPRRDVIRLREAVTVRPGAAVT